MKNLREPLPTQPTSHDESHRRGQLLLQTLPILLIPIGVGIVFGVLLALFNGNRLGPVDVPANDSGPLIPIVVLAVFFTALIVLMRLGRANISVYLLIGAWTLITTLLGLQMGVTSQWPALLIVPICAAGLLIDGVASISLAGLATLLILALGWLEMNGVTFAARVPPTPSFMTENAPVFASSFWIGVFWTIAALTFLLASGLQRALKQSRAHAEGLSELSAELEQRVQAQTAELLAQEHEAGMLEERTRVAREIHDTIAQGLTGIIVQLGAAERAMSAASPDAPRHLNLAQQMARESLAEARRSIWNLRSPTLEHGTLVDAFAGLVARQSHIKATFELRGETQTLSAAIESALLRVCQEALVNVAKHANATQAEVVLEFSETQVCLSVNDNGVGFEEEIMQSPDGVTSGFGLLGMRERIHALGGSLELKSENGARVIATIPYGEAK